MRNYLSLKPQGISNAIALNNLATACWWDKHPNYHYYNPDDRFDEEEDSDISEYNEAINKQREKDFELALPLYKNSLYFLQKEEIDAEI